MDSPFYISHYNIKEKTFVITLGYNHFDLISSMIFAFSLRLKTFTVLKEIVNSALLNNVYLNVLLMSRFEDVFNEIHTNTI
jgi:hypothetical protein